MKKLIFLLAIAALAFSNHGCKNSAKSGQDSTKVTVLSVDSFLLAPEKWADKEVTIKGTVSHVCRESGKKVFLFGKDPEKTLKVNAGGDHATFDIKLEGSEVEIAGKVTEDKKIDTAYLNNWEKEIKQSLADDDKKTCTEDKKAVSGQTCSDKKKKEEAKDPYAKVNEYRKKLAESGKPYIPVYAVTCKTLKEIKK